MPTKAKIRVIRKTRMPAKWQRILTPQIIISAVLCVFCALMAIVCLLNPGTKEISVTSPVEDMTPLDMVTPKDHVVQKFTADNDYTKFGFYYANFANYIQGGKLYINVENPQKEITEFAYNIGSTFDNSFLYIDYALKKDETYTVTIYLSDDAQGITFFTTTADNYNATLTINKHIENASIIMVFNNTTKDTFAAWYYILTIVLIMCYIVLKIDRSVYDQKN